MSYPTYYWIATVVSFLVLLRHPTRMDGMDNWIGSLIVAVLFGWALWWAFVIVLIVGMRRRSP